MSTNFYHRYNHCDCCGRFDERHIGKNWTMFRGYRPDPDYDYPDDFVGTQIVSWQDWKRVLRQDGEVWNEYGVHIDTEEFIREVESTHPAQRRRQYDWIVDHYVDHRYDWLDPEGFSFHDGEFC